MECQSGLQSEAISNSLCLGIPTATQDHKVPVVEVVSRYSTSSLVDCRALPWRIRSDTKFLISRLQLTEVLRDIQKDYSVLAVEGKRLQRYRTLYFDTEDFEFYRKHHSGARNRCKVRCRHYLETDQAYLEVKRKFGARRSCKQRTAVTTPFSMLDERDLRFIELHTSVEALRLQPKLWNEFRRITLISKDSSERVTLDLEIHFRTATGAVNLPGLVVSELKQSSIDRSSPFWMKMREVGSRPTGFSKYCTGTTMLNPGVKSNRFRKRLRAVERILLGGEHAC